MQPILFLCLFCSGFILHAQNNLLKNPNFQEIRYNYLGDIPRMDSSFSELVDWSSIGKSIEAVRSDYNIPSSQRDTIATLLYQKSRQGLDSPAVLLFLGTFPLRYHHFGREYLVGRLRSPLQAGLTYRLELDICLPEVAWVGLNKLGFELCAELPNLFDYNPRINPQAQAVALPQRFDTWMRLKTEFTAQGGEQFVVFGCFEPENQLRFRWTHQGKTFRTAKKSSGQYLAIKYISISPVQEPAPIPGRD